MASMLNHRVTLCAGHHVTTTLADFTRGIVFHETSCFAFNITAAKVEFKDLLPLFANRVLERSVNKHVTFKHTFSGKGSLC